MEKYFIPSIEDIHVGYECEFYVLGSGNNYVPFIVKADDPTVWNIYKNQLELGWIKTPYLTKEQIEAEGWVFTGEQYESKQSFEIVKSPHGHLELRYTPLNTNLVIYQRNHVRDGSSRYTLGCIFRGKCPSINEFRTICKLLNIK